MEHQNLRTLGTVRKKPVGPENGTAKKTWGTARIKPVGIGAKFPGFLSVLTVFLSIHHEI